VLAWYCDAAQCKFGLSDQTTLAGATISQDF
jgi:hypothetical protein